MLDKSSNIYINTMNGSKKPKIKCKEEKECFIKKRLLKILGDSKVYCTIEQLEQIIDFWNFTLLELEKIVNDIYNISTTNENKYIKLFDKNQYTNITIDELYLLVKNSIITITKLKIIAKKLNLSIDDNIFPIHILNQIYNDNSTIFTLGQLTQFINIFNEDFPDFENKTKFSIQYLIENNTIIRKKHYYTTEKLEKGEIYIENEMLNINSTYKDSQYIDVKNSNLNKKQQEAVKAMCCTRISIIIGGPGVGKTTTIKKYIEHKLSNDTTTVIAVALAGTAAKQITNSFPNHPRLKIGTIAKELLYNIDSETGEFKYKNEYLLIIIDEFSMVDMFTFIKILKIIKNIGYDKVQLILVGDPNQLPSIGCGKLLKDFINSKKFKCVELTEIMRTDKKNIITTLNNIKSNKFNNNSIINGDGISFKIVNKFTIDNLRESLKSAIKNLNFKHSNNDIILSCANGSKTRYENLDQKHIQKYLASCYHINKMMQDLTNPIKENITIEIPNPFGRSLYQDDYRTRDRIITKINNYDTIDTMGTIVYKGTLGYIHSYDKIKGVVFIEYDSIKGRLHEIPIKILYSEDYKLAYCLTVHLSQGSTFNNVICVFNDAHYTFIKNGRKISYTGISRSKNHAHVITTKKSIIPNNYNKCIFNNDNFIRTGLFK
jgi:exodeoxyribonuclease V alpha subunit